MLQPQCRPATCDVQVFDVHYLQDVPTQIVSWANLNTTSVPQTHPAYNESSWVGTGMWSLETICDSVIRSQEVVAGQLDL
jgi:hypothetical protein